MAFDDLEIFVLVVDWCKTLGSSKDQETSLKLPLLNSSFLVSSFQF